MQTVCEQSGVLGEIRDIINHCETKEILNYADEIKIKIEC